MGSHGHRLRDRSRPRAHQHEQGVIVILTRPRRSLVVAVAASTGLLLSGCGSSLGIHPGAAASVGGQTVSMSKIDHTTTLYCTAYVNQSQQSQQGSTGPIPMGAFRSYVASS